MELIRGIIFVAWYAMQVTPASISGLDFGQIGQPNKPADNSQKKGSNFQELISRK